VHHDCLRNNRFVSLKHEHNYQCNVNIENIVSEKKTSILAPKEEVRPSLCCCPRDHCYVRHCYRSLLTSWCCILYSFWLNMACHTVYTNHYLGRPITIPRIYPNSVIIIIIIIIIIITVVVVLLSQVFFTLVPLLLSQWSTQSLRLQVSGCNTFLTMCDVPSMAVFCRESVVCYPCSVSRFLNFYLQFPCPQRLLVWQTISCSTFAEFLYLDCYILISSQPPFVLHSCPIIIIIISYHRFSFFPGTSPLEPVMNPTTQASSLSL
jgi:hypothetical protein